MAQVTDCDAKRVPTCFNIKRVGVWMHLGLRNESNDEVDPSNVRHVGWRQQDTEHGSITLDSTCSKEDHGYTQYVTY